MHRHVHEDEISYVLEGELTAQLGDTISTIGPGEFVVKPRNQWHTFWNAGSEPLRFLEIVAPGAFASYFEELSEVIAEGAQPDEATVGRLLEIAANYDIDMRPESIPELMERHGLQM